MKTINNYILKQFLIYTFLGLLIFTFILLIDKIFDLISLIINQGINLKNVFSLLGYTLPPLLSLTIPMAFLFGILLTYNRLTQNNEIVALKSSGINLLVIAKPILIFSFLTSIFLLFFNNYIAPAKEYQFNFFSQQLLTDKQRFILEEKTFIDLNNYEIFVNKIDDSSMKGIIIYQLRKEQLPILITAMEGNFQKKEDQKLLFNLYNGNICTPNINNPSIYDYLKFNNYTFTIDLSLQKSPFRQKKIREMTTPELNQEIIRLKEKNIPPPNYNPLLVEKHLRNVVAFASFFFCILGIPLGLKGGKGGKSMGIALCIILIFIYYLLLMWGINLGEKVNSNPAIFVWIPNIFLGIIGIYLNFKINK